MILVTGANGQTGRAIIKKLLSKNMKVRAFVRKDEDVLKMNEIEVTDVYVGDLMQKESLQEGLNGVRAIYHICSVFNPNEVVIGENIIEVAKELNIEHFVYHSVLHSVLQKLPHHQKKLQVEEILINSNIPYTIIQPAVFMQNILENFDELYDNGVFIQKFFTNNDTRMCFIDLEDLAEAVAIIFSSDKHKGLTYELCGSRNLNLEDMTDILNKVLYKEIIVKTPNNEEFAKMLKVNGASDYFIDVIIKMFDHYNEHGFIGNRNVLTWLLEREPNNFQNFIYRTIKLRKQGIR